MANPPPTGLLIWTGAIYFIMAVFALFSAAAVPDAPGVDGTDLDSVFSLSGLWAFLTFDAFTDVFSLPPLISAGLAISVTFPWFFYFVQLAIEAVNAVLP